MKDSRIIKVRSASGFNQIQVNLPLNLEDGKADDFVDRLQKLADAAKVEDGKLVKKRIAVIDDAVTVYAVSLGIVNVNVGRMTGRAVVSAEMVSDAALSGDKKQARETLKKTVDVMFPGIDWKIENRHINMMTCLCTKRHDRVNSRGTQTGNIDRAGRIDVRAWCDTVRSLTQCRVKIMKVFE